MTVRPEKSTRLPMRLPRILPSLPLRRCVMVLSTGGGTQEQEKRVSRGGLGYSRWTRRSSTQWLYEGGILTMKEEYIMYIVKDESTECI